MHGVKGVMVMEDLLNTVRRTRPIDLVALAGKLAGVGLFAALIYSYCSVLIEACFRGIR